MTGPKIFWYGNRDCEPDCRTYDFVGGPAIARTIRSHTEDMLQAGLDLIALNDHDIAALADTDLNRSARTSAIHGPDMGGTLVTVMVQAAGADTERSRESMRYGLST